MIHRELSTHPTSTRAAQYHSTVSYSQTLTTLSYFLPLMSHLYSLSQGLHPRSVCCTLSQAIYLTFTQLGSLLDRHLYQSYHEHFYMLTPSLRMGIHLPI